MVLEVYTWVGLAALFLPLLTPSVAGECIRLDQDTILLNDLKDMKDRHCYRCYQVLAPKQLQVQLHRMRLKGLSSVMIYIDGSANHVPMDCGECQGENACQECKEVARGTMFELYLRQDTNLELEEGQNACQYIASFNITLDVINDEPEVKPPLACDKGFLATFPQAGDSCLINTTAVGTENHCLVPTCAEDILSSDPLVERIEHKFKASSLPETCVWRLNTEQHKQLTLSLSKDIRPHLTVFEDSLTNPRWDVQWCSGHSDNYKLDTVSDTVFVVYHNTDGPTKKSSLTITQQAACLIPPSLENGDVGFKRLESGMVALYSCNHGYTLIGPSKLRCKDGAWSDPPVCLHDKDKLMSDAPMDSVESVDSANVTDLAPENDTNLTTDDNSEQEMKLDTVVKDDGDVMMDLNNEGETEVEKDGEDYTTSEPDIEGDQEMKLYPTFGFDQDDEYSSNDTLDTTQQPSSNTTEGTGGIFTGLLNLNLKEDMYTIIIAGAGLAGLLLLIIIITVVVYRKRYPMSGLGRRFDTFQNPIYEKAVVRVPLQVEEPPPEEKKASDAEEISNCTMLEP
ncbi:uncharacterized protein LOC123501354 isoform X1 [Portunus trituberculatus]|uniref:uncharacterized protein LOC123501354 isoform X1 n=1 Tax=Portunus trituberculatus TaxID=210409 RepID=UPI001E1D118E|nr:uncharacterized protein LOC123501354 isoform X1 [Portunus trituberculatus]XP_045106079.1 uncharacterized protein LOC123501354 isoform X1 [Portunus trituberculatus]XP_045106080.1 uncharacterized protein LOC123501354 isoform X1 [Portunus trituberculatus]XP_045106081.1 uncharacterized protein LOC123501354 isoform X1 [Portunus trituberculatus]XP_045106082.1 uncharacterized protein LOC123501354 isoform X1 [Portunus trituberculatus]XP_045106083.1 uncharacterized protein LOC123501354 isoform X1 [P